MSPELYYCRGQFGLIKMDLFVTVFGGLNWPLYWGQTPVPSEQALLKTTPSKRADSAPGWAISEDDESFVCLLQAKTKPKYSVISAFTHLFTSKWVATQSFKWNN